MRVASERNLLFAFGHDLYGFFFPGDKLGIGIGMSMGYATRKLRTDSGLAWEYIMDHGYMSCMLFVITCLVFSFDRIDLKACRFCYVMLAALATSFGKLVGAHMHVASSAG